MSRYPQWYLSAKQYPVVTSLVVLSALGGMLVSNKLSFAISYFSFGGIDGSSYFRLVTPIFLHFGMLHFIFNSLWLAMLGSRIEGYFGGLHLLALVVISGIVSNLSQAWWSGSVLFGGMSGVVYALIGYLWIVNKVYPTHNTALPKGIVPFMIGWLVLCMTPIVSFIMGAGIANAAHVGGLLCGMLLGTIFGLQHKLRNANHRK